MSDTRGDVYTFVVVPSVFGAKFVLRDTSVIVLVLGKLNPLLGDMAPTKCKQI